FLKLSRIKYEEIKKVNQCNNGANLAPYRGNFKSTFLEGGFFNSQSAYPKQFQLVWNTVVGRDVIVPVMNANNPLLAEINLMGLSQSKLFEFINQRDSRNWGVLAGTSKTIPLHLYLANDQSTLSGLAEFLNVNQSEMSGISPVSVSELADAVQKDPNALGFCRLVDVTGQKDQQLAAGLKLVPIDQNGNGKIDYMENIYENLQSFSRGVWIGKYPKALSSRIYLVTDEKIENPTELAFVKWILTDGQPLLTENGFSELFYSERQSQLARYDTPANYTEVAVEKANTFLALLLLMLFFIVMTGVVIDLIFRRFRNRKRAPAGVDDTSNLVFDENLVSVPKGLYFDKTHTWAFRKKNGLVKVGMDDFMQHVTGIITRIELKNAGDNVKKGEFLFSIVRQGKMLNIYSPVSGKITSLNKNLLANPSLVNLAPYNEGWVYEIEPANWELEMQYLTLADKYINGLKLEFTRLKEFFGFVYKPHSLAFAQAVLQDGGALKDHVLADLGPEVWDDFQTRFIDGSR
ncbi:MAG: hypothetical protein WAO52_14940, partial [Prolixibacteraceae bacterium]